MLPWTKFLIDDKTSSSNNRVQNVVNFFIEVDPKTSKFSKTFNNQHTHIKYLFKV